MGGKMNLRVAGAALASALFACAAAPAAPLTIPFDFSHGAIGLDVRVKGTPLHVLLDTGVDPSAIDVVRADALGLRVDRHAAGEASGEGNAKQALVFPSTIEGLAIGGQTFHPIDALAMDMTTLSAHYGRKLDGVLGFSFLTDKIVLIDYPDRTLELLDQSSDAASAVQTCRKRWSTALQSFEGDSIPVIRDFKFGGASAPISLDTGSNGGISLYQGALDLPGLRAALAEHGDAAYAGARGGATAKSYVLNEPVGFGPFTLPAGQIVTLRNDLGSSDTRLANVGNKLFAAMNLKILLDYRARQMTFYGDCQPQ